MDHVPALWDAPVEPDLTSDAVAWALFGADGGGLGGGGGSLGFGNGLPTPGIGGSSAPAAATAHPPRCEDDRAALRAALARALAVVEDRPERRWAREFVLDQSPQAAVSMLTNAAALPHAITADSADTLFETDGAHSGLFDALIRYDGLFVPAFSAGSLAVGVVVDRVACRGGAVCAMLCGAHSRSSSSNANDGNGGSQPAAPSRLCADPLGGQARRQQQQQQTPKDPLRMSDGGAGSTGASGGGGGGGGGGCRRQSAFPSTSQHSLPSMDSVATPLYSVGRYVRDTDDGRLLIVKHLGPSDHGPPIRTVISFLDTTSSTRSKRILIFCDGPTFKTGNILDSIRHCINAVDSRFCPLCNAPPNAQCGCKLPTLRPAHPLDFSRNHQIMSTYTGDYLGTTRATFVMPTAPVGQHYVSGSLLSSMRVNGYGIGDTQHEELSAVLQAFAVQLAISDAMPTRGVMPHVAQITAASEETECATPDPCPNDTSDMDSMLASLDAVVDAECSGSAMDFVLSTSSASQVKGAVPPLSPVPDGFSLSTGELDRRSSPSLRMGFSAPKAVAANPTREIITSTAGLAGYAAPKLRMENSAHHETGRGEPVSLGLYTRRDDKRTSLDAEHQREVGEPSTSADDQVLRGIRRKMKNREAAARSNARRKAKNDMLKKGLIDAKQLVTELRRKETRLREENLALRRRVYAIGSTRGQS